MKDWCDNYVGHCKMNHHFLRMAKRVRDAEGGVSQCGEQRSTKRSEARSSPTRRETPKNNLYFVLA
jgi:hypothetical protein